MASLYYIANSADGAKVYFDLDPVPIPTVQYNREVSVDKTIPTKAGIVWQAGVNIVTDAGKDLSDGRIRINLPYVSQSVKNSLQTKYDTAARVVFYNADSGEKYRCAWAGGNSFNVYHAPGSVTFRAEIELIPLEAI